MIPHKMDRIGLHELLLNVPLYKFLLPVWC